MLAKRNIDKIKRLEAANKQLPQIDIETVERFIGSMYTRQIKIPAGTVITSRVYKRAYVDIMISGDITISDSNGTYRLSGYNVLEGTPGRKRAGFAHEDTYWITVHDLVDIKTEAPIEDISFETLEAYESYRVDLATSGYERFLQHTGVDEALVNAESESGNVLEVLGDFYTDESSIHGVGVFASKRLTSGTIVGPTVIEGKETTLSRFANHSDYPNAMIQGDHLIMVHPVDAGHEIVINYQFSPRGLQ